MLVSHAPQDYICPICLGVEERENTDTLMKQTDVIYRDDLVTVFVNSFFIKGNEGHVIIVPNRHHENIYELPQETGHRVFDIAQKVAIAMKSAYKCDGITARQNNEPAGDQHAFHYHLHVFPRYTDDDFNTVQATDKRLAEPEERARYAEQLRRSLD